MYVCKCVLLMDNALCVSYLYSIRLLDTLICFVKYYVHENIKQVNKNEAAKSSNNVVSLSARFSRVWYIAFSCVHIQTELLIIVRFSLYDFNKKLQRSHKFCLTIVSEGLTFRTLVLTLFLCFHEWAKQARGSVPMLVDQEFWNRKKLLIFGSVKQVRCQRFSSTASRFNHIKHCQLKLVKLW